MDAEIQDLFNQMDSMGLYGKFLDQLNKDFLRAGLVQEFSQKILPLSLSRNLTACIYELIISDFEKYLNLLYAVDISEKEVKKLPIQRVDELAVSVSAMILKREWQKVLLRMNH